MTGKKKKLVIVESPAKARTLSKILGTSYHLKASLGHIRDLPRGKLGVDVENDFQPQYVVPREKSKLAGEFKKSLKEASVIYLATDPDREGEAIAWHLLEVLKPGTIPVRRVVFHEITEEAIKHAFKDTRDLDMRLVNAQQARRVLDRLVGYKISPLLWKKIRRGLSAGRVQSVALKIVVDREREITAFKAVEYWTIDAELTKPADDFAFCVTLVGLRDGTKIDVKNEAEATRLKKELKEADYSVDNIATKRVIRQPAAPFITSTLQQEAWRKLRFSAKQTMAIAQQLYEGLSVDNEGSVGLITYMRTDSTRVADSAIAETRGYIGGKYGEQYLPAKPRAFTKKAKGAQEAHEAIRPTRIHRQPDLIKDSLTTAQARLYELIWKRMVASQMSAAQYDNTTVDVAAKRNGDGYLLRKSSLMNTFPGFTALYSEGKDEEETEKKERLPGLKKGEGLKLRNLFPEQHFTQPPPRYTEASLIKALERWGIGRPSTYAPTLSTIQDREYVNRIKGSFEPTKLGFVVNDLLVEYFSDIMSEKFTAGLENKLDEIASDKRDWVSVIKDFYGPLEKDLETATEKIEKIKLPDELTDELCPKCDKQLAIKTGRFGKFLACTGYPECKFTKSFQIKTGAKCPECGKELVQKVNKKKRVFYGCSGYPECKFLINAKPLAEPCPKCGGLLTAGRGGTAKCAKCDFMGKVDKEQG